MRNIAVLTIAALLCSCGQRQTYRIWCDAAGTDGKVYLLDSKRNAIDSAVIVDGKFVIDGVYTEAMRCYVADNADISSADNAALLFIEPGTISIANEDDGWYATGTPSNDSYRKLSAVLDALDQEYYADGTTEERKEQIDREYNEAVKAAVDANLDNIFGLYEFTNLSYELDGQETVDYLSGFSEAMQGTGTWKSMMEAAQKKLLVDVGKSYIDFSQSDMSGNDISLQSVIEAPGNKYVLLDFWASWCGPCMGEVPFLVRDYAKYHDCGFEIFGSSLDRDADKWKNAVNSNNMDWIHVSDLKYWDNSGAELYAVRSIPSNFLIDCSTGTIVARNLRGEALSEKLVELLDSIN